MSSREKAGSASRLPAIAPSPRIRSQPGDDRLHGQPTLLPARPLTSEKAHDRDDHQGCAEIEDLLAVADGAQVDPDDGYVHGSRAAAGGAVYSDGPPTLR